MPATTYTLSQGVLNSVTNGVSTPILSEVVSFAVEQSGDVLALKMDHVLYEKRITGANWNTFGTNVANFVLDFDDDLVLAAMSSGAVWQAPADQTADTGRGLWTTAGYSHVTLSDGSLWYLGSATDSQGNHPVLRFVKGNLTPMPGAAVALSLVEGVLFSFGNSQVQRWTGSAWVRHPSSNGNYYFLGPTGTSDRSVYHWSGGQNVVLLEGQKAVSVGNYAGRVWALNSHGEVWHWNGSAWDEETTAKLSNSAPFFLDIGETTGKGDYPVQSWSKGQLVRTYIKDTTQVLGAVSVNVLEGKIWAANTSGQRFLWNGTAWVEQPRAISAIGSQWFLGSVISTSAGGYVIYKMDGGQIAATPGRAVALAAGDGSIVAINFRKQAMRWSGDEWTRLKSINDSEGSTWFLGGTTVNAAGDHEVFRYYKGRLGRMQGEASELSILEKIVFGRRAISNSAILWSPSGWSSVSGVKAADGSLWFLGSLRDKKGNSSIYRFGDSGAVKMPGLATRIVESGDVIWSLDGAGVVRRWSGAQWIQVGTGMKSLADGGKSTPFAVTNIGTVVQFDGTSWIPFGGVVSKASDGSEWFLGIAVASDGNHAVERILDGKLDLMNWGTAVGVAEGIPWMVDATGKVLRWSETYVGWDELPSGDTVRTSDGTIWFLGTGPDDGINQHGLFQFKNNELIKLPGVAKDLLGVAEGVVWIMDALDQVSFWDGSAWVKRPSATAADGSVWMLGVSIATPSGDHPIYRISNGRILAPTDVFVALASRGRRSDVYAVNAFTKQVFRWDGTSHSQGTDWRTVPSAVASDGSRLFLGSGSDGNGNRSVYRYVNGQIKDAPGYGIAIFTVGGTAWLLNNQNKASYWQNGSWVNQTTVATGDGSVWFLGTVKNGQGNYTIYRWNGTAAASTSGVATGLWVSGSDVWSINAQNNLAKWNGSAWMSQGSFTASNGGFELTQSYPQPPLLLLNLSGSNDDLGKKISDALKIKATLDKIWEKGPNSAYSRLVIGKYLNKKSLWLETELQEVLNEAYDADPLEDRFSNGNWGNTITELIWDGFNPDLSSHYREVTLKHGYWRRGGVGTPELSLKLTYTGFDEASDRWNFHLKLAVDIPLYIEVQEWSHGVQLLRIADRAVASASIEFDIALYTPKLTFDTSKLRLIGSFAAQESQFNADVSIDLGNTIGDKIFREVLGLPLGLPFLNLLVDSYVFLATAETERFFQKLRVELSPSATKPGSVQLEIYFNGTLAQPPTNI